jgi:hypothetical protein
MLLKKIFHISVYRSRYGSKFYMVKWSAKRNMAEAEWIDMETMFLLLFLLLRKQGLGLKDLFRG